MNSKADTSNPKTPPPAHPRISSPIETEPAATTMGGKRQISIRLEEEHYEALQRLAARRGTAVAIVAREAIHAYLYEHDADFRAMVDLLIAASTRPTPGKHPQ